MFGLTFLNSLFLLGVLSALIPIILHFGHRERAQRVQFSSIRFFTEEHQRRQRRIRLRQLLLLILRVLLCIVFALAFAKPLLRIAGGSILGANVKRDVVILLDNSYSMGYKHQGRTRFALAQESAISLINSMKTGDRASLILVNESPQLYIEQLTSDLKSVETAISEAELSNANTNISKALESAYDILKQSSSASKEMYLLTDMQRNGNFPVVQGDNPRISSPQFLKDAQIRLFIVDVAQSESSNAAITGLEFSNNNSLLNIPTVFKIKVHNYSDKPQKRTLRLFIDGQKVVERTVELYARFPAVERFSYLVEEGGLHGGYVSLDTDALSVDDRYYFSMRSIEELPILCVDGAPSAVSYMSETFYLKHALKSAKTSAKSVIQPTIIEPDQFKNVELDKFSLIILANVSTLTTADVQRLEEYVNNGGGLLIFLGDRINSYFYNTHLSGSERRHQGLLPGKLLDVLGEAKRKSRAFRISKAYFQHPAFNVFEDPTSGNLGSIRFYKFYALDTAGTEGQTLLELDNGYPLLMERQYGLGKVMLFASACDVDWTDFPLRALYVPLLYRLTAYLSEQANPVKRYWIGDTIQLSGELWSYKTPVTLTKPNGSVEILKAQPQGTMSVVTYQKADRAGIYQFEHSQLGQKRREMFALNLKTAESDLSKLGDDEIKALTADPGKGTLVRVISNSEQLTGAAEQTLMGAGLWDKLLFVVLLIVLLEPFIANRIARALSQ